MRTMLFFLFFVVTSQTLWAGEEISVPWEEFKTLYRESIERKIGKAAPKEKEPQVYSIDEALYSLEIGTRSAKGELILSGKVISGEAEPIQIFDKEIPIIDVKQVIGGTLLCRQDEDQIVFLPDGSKDFQIDLTFLVHSQEDSRSRFVSFHIPSALKNSLSLELSPETRLVEHPGIVDAGGRFHFSAKSVLTVKYSEKKGISSAQVVDIDNFSRVTFKGNRTININSFFFARTLPTSCILLAPEGTRYKSSSLKSSCIKKIDKNRYQLDLPSELNNPFTIQFTLDTAGSDNGFSFLLPRIMDNNGKEGVFVLEQPDDGQITFAGEAVVSRIPVSRLDSRLRKVVGKERFLMQIPSHEKIHFTVKQFQTVDSPLIVLDSISFFTSFEENGSILSVLRMNIPAEAGPRLILKSVPGAQVWSLKVNGETQRVYSDEKDKWIIPLSKGGASKVELAYIRKGRKMGLSGRLETILPETGLPSRNVFAGVALPPRVQLLSLEGPVSPKQVDPDGLPKEFVGKSYFFSRSFYKGDGMKMAISYKEPVNNQKDH